MMGMILNLLRGRMGWILIGIIGVSAIAFMSYSHMKIQTLEATVEARNQRVEFVESQYEQLSSNYGSLEEDFTTFAKKVNSNLREQRERNREVREVNSDYNQKIEDLEQKFLYDSNGRRRDWDKIIDTKSGLLQNIINKQLEGLGDEFENIGGYRDGGDVDSMREQ